MAAPADAANYAKLYGMACEAIDHAGFHLSMDQATGVLNLIPKTTQPAAPELTFDDMEIAMDVAAKVAQGAGLWQFVADAFDDCTTGRSERILEDLGLPSDNAHRTLEWHVRRRLGQLTPEELAEPT